ncbi:conserved protein of unknown function [Streptococcus thermophilus]|uniref:DUF6414 family protein n=2 Tax=Streptococcus thermophilus TaxID=1308 RepID=UPI0015C26B24|nr:hypothetical protein [Streptococcus thermophilus]CAD0147526.1 conserved protein of unknown function [Streptococcus thermophilus]CAD0150206.1 conserved protein of unknown function [Streptococcus thermophilus]
MKEIIYLDTNLVNSLLAQQNAGLVTKLVNENSESDSNAEGGFDQTATSVSGGVSTLIRADVNHSSIENENYNIVFSRSNRNLIETALDDYSLDLLLQELEDDKLLKSSNFRDGDFIFTAGKFDFFDFEQLKNVFTFDEIEDILPEYDKFKKLQSNYKRVKNNAKKEQLKDEISHNVWNNLESIRSMSAYSERLFPFSNLAKVSNTISVLPKEFMKVPTAQLGLMQLSERQIKILGICSSTFDKQIPSDLFMAANSIELLKKAPTAILTMMLDSFGLVSSGDYLIRPIAIYYEG